MNKEVIVYDENEKPIKINIEKFNKKLNEIRKRGNINNKPISCYDEETGEISYFDTVEEMVNSW